MTVENLVLLQEEEFDDKTVRQVLANYVSALPGENETMEALQRRFNGSPDRKAEGTLPFTSSRKYGGISFGPGDCWLLGAPEFLLRQAYGDYREEVEKWADLGCRVLLLAASRRPGAPGQQGPAGGPGHLPLLRGAGGHGEGHLRG